MEDLGEGCFATWRLLPAEEEPVVATSRFESPEKRARTKPLASAADAVGLAPMEFLERSRHFVAPSTPKLHHIEQLEKSISFGITAGPGEAFNGFPPESRLVVMNEGVQSVVLPLIGTNASARIE